MRVQSLHIYPVKGVRAVDLSDARVGARGLDGDRRWLATDEEGVFLTQRTCPALAMIDAEAVENGLRLSVEGSGITVTPPAGGRRTVTIWRDAVDAADAGEDAAGWLSEALGRPVRLFYMDDASERMTSERWGRAAPVSFADSNPVLIAASASLQALNAEIVKDGGAAVGMERFRPNVVIDGDDPWAEDYWKTVKIGDMTFDIVKPCDRCEVMTRDQRTGDRKGKEPLKTLAKLRRSADPRINGVLFGWHAIPRGEGDIAVGDSVDIMESRLEGWPIA